MLQAVMDALFNKSRKHYVEHKRKVAQHSNIRIGIAGGIIRHRCQIQAGESPIIREGKATNLTYHGSLILGDHNKKARYTIHHQRIVPRGYEQHVPRLLCLRCYTVDSPRLSRINDTPVARNAYVKRDLIARQRSE